MGFLRRALRNDRCVPCGRLRPACICRNVERGHIKAARKGGVDPTPRPCPNGCGRTMRGGICPGPDC